jgi:hypothetical protein
VTSLSILHAYSQPNTFGTFFLGIDADGTVVHEKINFVPNAEDWTVPYDWLDGEGPPDETNPVDLPSLFSSPTSTDVPFSSSPADDAPTPTPTQTITYDMPKSELVFQTNLSNTIEVTLLTSIRLDICTRSYVDSTETPHPVGSYIVYGLRYRVTPEGRRVTGVRAIFLRLQPYYTRMGDGWGFAGVTLDNPVPIPGKLL